ncbi:MAG: phosphoenolpyruvate synthase [Lachnospiraceae bacterium]|nr:phosphoenolpyruvate synthase [Lachnospiraceae bacterium]
MMNKYILNFEQIKKEDVNAAGGKGANLGEMTGASIPVPKGYVVLSSAYDAFMDYNKIDVNQIDSAKGIREAIINGNIPAEIKDEIVKSYRELSSESNRVAVRSSATAEDLADASFAGQQETYLNVVGEEELLEKIKECFASLWGERAVSYRKQSGYDKQKVALAVVVQSMVESESSGVMFTKDPAGDVNNLHINASYGLGEAVVSGIVSPDEYIVDREGNIVKKFLGSKEIEIIYSKENGLASGKDPYVSHGTVKVDVDEKRRSSFVLDDDMIKALVLEGLKIENHYGKPMDIEWAIREGKIYILQARCITTLSKETKTFTEEDFANYPKVRPAKGSMRENVLFNLEKTPTPYYPLDHDFGGFIGMQKEVLFNEIGILFGDSMYPIDDDGVSMQSSNKVKITKNVFQIPKYLKMLKDSSENIKLADKSLKECNELFDKEKNAKKESVEEIGHSLKRMHDLIGKTAYDRFLYALFPNFLVSGKVTKILKKTDSNLNSYDILEGLEYVTADINREMASLSKKIRQDTNKCNYVLNHSYIEICEEYPDLNDAFDAFLARFGSKSDFNCYCFISKTWREDPDRFINTLRPMLKSDEDKVPGLEEGLRKYGTIMDKVKSTVSDKKYLKFEENVNALRHYHYVREASQYLWESEFEFCRKLLMDLSGLLNVSYNDLLFLFDKELYEVCQNGELGNYSEIIERRKNKRAFAEAYWNKCMEDALATEDGSINGIGASVGQASGKVCIIKSPEEFGKLSQGDILVCTYTDPEWTPLFTLAAGVVVDTGGTLSHAAIVAREYNIPAVLATGDATKKLKDGDNVLVDGSSGKVMII